MCNFEKKFSVRTILCALIMMIAYVSHGQSSVSNHKILTNIGMQKVNLSPNYYKKRLAEESRHHSATGDSRIFVVKLPPNPYYYTPNSAARRHSDDRSQQFKQPSIQFQTNGKPNKIYHWNVPVLKHMVKEAKLRQKHSAFKKSASASASVSALASSHSIKKSYYVPIRKQKSVFYRFAHGNGKPYSFYTINSFGQKSNFQKLINT